MTSPWTVKATTERVDLDSTGKAEITFTVTNNGPVDQRLVFDTVPDDGASRSWFEVARPQVLVTHDGSAPVLVNIAVPAGTPAGPHWFAGRAYSADRAPEETSVVSDRVAFEVKPSERPLPWWRRWWWVFAVAALVLIVVAVVLFLVLGGEDPPPAEPPPGDAAKVPTVVRDAAAISFSSNGLIDLDEIVVGGPARANDLRYEPLLPSDGFIQPQNGTRLAKIGPANRPAEACVNATLSGDQVQVSQWQLGEVLCVRTNAGRLSVVILNQKISALSLPPPPPQLRVSITTFEPAGDGQ